MKLKSLSLGGFKSFASGPPGEAGGKLDLGGVTVLLGANGAGKSNVVSFFRMLGYLTTGALQRYVGEAGTAETLLHFGSGVTAQIEAELKFEGDGATDIYRMTLAAAQPDTLVFGSEAVVSERAGETVPYQRALGSGHRETLLDQQAQLGQKPSQVLLRLLRGCRAYQFHDTSNEAKIRKSGYIEDAAYLRSNGGNLAAYLYGLKQTHAAHYERIVRTIRQVCPQLGDIVLEPSARNDKYILLNWRDAHGPDYLMGPHQLSDGTLRFMALTTLLLQPRERLPSVIVLDEPELGLHPSAISVLADMVRGVTPHGQVIMATQSPTLVNHFSLEEIRPIEYQNGRSALLALNPEEYESWLEDYTTGELWQKDVFGEGRAMADVYAVVEGYGEHGFLRACVAPHLGLHGVYFHPTLVGKPGHKGGARPWPAVRKDITNFLRMGKKGRPVHVTMMFDYFRMPLDWPGRASAPTRAMQGRAAHVEEQLAADMVNHLGSKFDPALFLPYVQMHELEALVLAEPRSLAAEFPGQDEAIETLMKSIRGLPTEDINDGATTAPSKRIIAYLPEYEGRKAQAAVNVLELTGLGILRQRCPHFHDWLARLEALGEGCAAAV